MLDLVDYQPVRFVSATGSISPVSFECAISVQIKLFMSLRNKKLK